MRNIALPDGIWPVMITPMFRDGMINYNALKVLIKWYESSGMNGLFTNCLSSEMFELSKEERLGLTRFVVENSRVQVISTGTFSQDLSENLEMISQLYNMGTSAVVLITSILADENESDQTLLSRIYEISEALPHVPLGLYECPEPYKRLLSGHMISELSSTNRFLYLKDTSCNHEEVREKISSSNHTNFKLFNAHTPHLRETIEYGGAGFSPIGANFYPELYAYIWNNRMNKKLHNDVEKVMKFIIKHDPTIHEKYPLSAKYFLQLRGLPIEMFTRKNMMPLNEKDKSVLNNIYDELQSLKAKLGMHETVLL